MSKLLNAESAWKFGEQGKVNDKLYMFECGVIRREEVVRAMLSGKNERLLSMLPALARFLHTAAQARPGDGALCMACETEFGELEVPTDFFVIVPGMTDLSGKDVILSGICSRCAQHDGRHLFEIGYRKVKEIWPDSVTCETGQA